MESFLAYFELMPTWQKGAWVFGMLGLSLLLETVVPLVRFEYARLRHIGVNLVFLAFTFVINLLFSVLTVGVFEYTAANKFGLLYLFELPVIVELLIAVLMFDLVAQYTVHYYLHKVKWMWKFHMVHHSDTHVDATTGTRHHPGDYTLREVFALLTIVISGAPFAYYMVYRIVTIVFTYLTHANVPVPAWLDKPLSYIFVTPNMHKFHHHFERPWTDTNFGNIFSFWDRAFKTLQWGDPRQVSYGLDVLDGSRDEDVLYQLKVPFDNTIKTDY